MKNDPLVSVIIPTYNRAAFIGHSVESVLGQTYSNIEVIVVDDGSTDDTQARLRRFGDKIQTVRQQNRGAASARNLGIKLSKGEIIACQDSDDIWKPTKLERQVDLLDRVGPSVPCCLCNATYQTSHEQDPDVPQTTVFDIAQISSPFDEAIWSNVADVLATRLVLFNQMAAIRRTALDRVGAFDETLRYWEEYDLSFRLAFEGPWALILEPLVVYREGSPGSIARQSLVEKTFLAQDGLKILDRVLSTLPHDSDPNLRRLIRMRKEFLRWNLRAAKVADMPSRSARGVGNAILALQRYGYAAFRRSPWYRSAKTVPVPQ